MAFFHKRRQVRGWIDFSFDVAHSSGGNSGKLEGELKSSVSGAKGKHSLGM